MNQKTWDKNRILWIQKNREFFLGICLTTVVFWTSFLLQRTITCFLYILFHVPGNQESVDKAHGSIPSLSINSYSLIILLVLCVLPLVLVSKSYLSTKPSLSCLQGTSLLIWYIKKIANKVVYNYDNQCRIIRTQGLVMPAPPPRGRSQGPLAPRPAPQGWSQDQLGPTRPPQGCSLGPPAPKPIQTPCN